MIGTNFCCSTRYPTRQEMQDAAVKAGISPRFHMTSNVECLLLRCATKAASSHSNHRLNYRLKEWSCLMGFPASFQAQGQHAPLLLNYHFALLQQ